jgi:tRNA dimethylallyltransferase
VPNPSTESIPSGIEGLRTKVLILAGPTASGKTDLAIALAQRYDAEIVNADSRQIYRDMPIGTAAPSDEQLRAVPHHVLGFLDPAERYSAARFAGDALTAIRDIHDRGKRAIVVGGTGFYIRALIGGVTLAPQYDDVLRERLARETTIHSPEFLHQWLVRRDPERAAMIHPGDRYRVVRALEIALAQPQQVSRDEPLPSLSSGGCTWLLAVLDVAAEKLDRRIAARTDRMLAGGLLEEAERIGEDAVAATAVGYPEALAYLRGWCSRDELRALLGRATRRYARRQRAWFRGERSAQWFAPEAVEAAVREKLGWSAKRD